MGLTATATRVIWLFAIFAAAGLALNAYFDVAPEITEARDGAQERLALRLGARLTAPTFCWADDKVRVEAQNLGSETLELSELAFLVDGELTTTYYTDVEGVHNVSFWPPGDDADFNLTGWPEPDRVMLVLSVGTPAHATKTTCPVLTTIVVTPATATVYLNGTQQFTATGYDQHGNVMGAAFDWDATAGSITATGLFTAPSTGGSVTITASAEGVDGTAAVTVLREAHVDALATYKVGVPSSSFRKGVDTVEVRATIRDHESALVAGASVTIEYVDGNDVVQATRTGTTDANGVASVTYALPSNAAQGSWTARVTSVTGTHLDYVSANNVVTSVGYAVTAN